MTLEAGQRWVAGCNPLCGGPAREVLEVVGQYVQWRGDDGRLQWQSLTRWHEWAAQHGARLDGPASDVEDDDEEPDMETVACASLWMLAKMAGGRLFIPRKVVDEGVKGAGVRIAIRKRGITITAVTEEDADGC